MTKRVIISAILLIVCISGAAIAYNGSDCDSESYYKPHSSDCALFFQCSPNGTYVLFTCPPDLHFNPILNVCDFPDDAGCGHGSTKDPESSESTTTFDGDTSTTDDSSPETCNNGDYLLRETDCEAFYRCISGSFVLIYCPEGMRFNIVSKGCEVYETDCKEIEESSQPSEGTTIDISTESSTELSTDASTELSAEPSTEISTDASTELSVEPSTEISTDASTEQTTDFSTETQTEFSTETSTELSTETSTELSTDTSTDISTEMSTDISTDIATETESSTFFTTESSSTEFEYSTTVECVTNEYKPDDTDCEAFYRCINGRFVKLFCSVGTYFNAITRMCTQAEEAGCVLETDGSTQSSEATSSEISTQTTQAFNEHSIEVFTEECIANEFQSDPSDCEAFYRCINGRFVKLFCSVGTHFNSETRLCVKPELAGCESTDF